MADSKNCEKYFSTGDTEREEDNLTEKHNVLLYDSEEDVHEVEIPDYNIGVRKGPPLFKDHVDNKSRDELDRCLQNDVAWAIAVGLNTENQNNMIGSWTDFNRKVTKVEQKRILLEYLPTIAQPPEYPVCKKFLDDLLALLEELELDHIFAHSDEQVYARLAHIIWKDPELYQNVIILMGGFHQLRVRQKTIFKRHAIKGYQQWVVDAKTIAFGSAAGAIEGRHYYRNMRINKEIFCALVQYRVEEITNDYKDLDPSLKEELFILNRHPSYENLQNVICHQKFKILCQNILKEETGSESKMTVRYLKDVSSLLALVSAVREKNLERHLQAEREMIKYCFAFDHVNYSRYLSYQQVYLRFLETSNIPAITDLKERGFGGSISGEPFSTIHGDLITELFNGQTKRQAGPHSLGFSTNIESVNDWVNTAHIHAKIRTAFAEKIHLTTNSTHKECTPGSRRLHFDHVKALKQQLRKYGINPFASGHAKDITTGEEIPSDLINGLIHADVFGDDIYKTFVQERLVDGTKSFFDPIKKVRLPTGLKTKKAKPKSLSVVKEDRQAFGLILGANVELLKALEYPVTTVPLSIANPDHSLRGGSKSNMRNFIVHESNAIENMPPSDSRWLFDTMSVMRSLKPKETYEEWFDYIINITMPRQAQNPLSLEFVNDTYRQISCKNVARSNRGQTMKRVHLENFGQKMPTGNEWISFFHNLDNKQSLIDLFSKYLLRKKFPKDVNVPIVFTNKEDTFEVTHQNSQILFKCNHEEADTRLILQACQKNTNCVVVSKDTDVFVLLVFAFAAKDIKYSWAMKIDHNKYINIQKVVQYLGKEIALKLPHVHAITGCDTTSFMFSVGKIKVLKKCMKQIKQLDLLSGFGESSVINHEIIQNVSKFIQTVCYSGFKDENLVETRVRLYRKMKTKTLQTLPPDPKSMEQAILRIQHQLYYWLKFDVKEIHELDKEKYGWFVDKENGTVTPVWFKGINLAFIFFIMYFLSNQYTINVSRYVMTPI